MNLRLLSAVTTLALATAPASHDLCYAPAVGASLTRDFSQEKRLEFKSLAVVIGGADIPSEYLPDMTLELESSSEVRVLDRVLAAGDGRPRQLERSFLLAEARASELFSMTPGAGEAAVGTAIGDATGETILFTWDADAGDAGEYEVERMGGRTGQGVELGGLAEDMDLRAFLPGDTAIELGDAWEVDGQALAGLLDPGGDLGWNWTRDPAMRRHDGARNVDWSGDLTATLASFTEGIAVMEIAGECEREASYASNLDSVPVADGTATVYEITTYALTGRLYWDVSAGHIKGAVLRADLDVLIETEKDAGQAGPDYESSMVLGGTWDCIVEVMAGTPEDD